MAAFTGHPACEPAVIAGSTTQNVKTCVAQNSASDLVRNSLARPNRVEQNVAVLSMGFFRPRFKRQEKGIRI